MQTWRNVPDTERAEWGPGPWQDEPDKAQWVDPATGLDCLIVRNPVGALCGYVGVSTEHPLHGKEYNNVPEEIADAAHHGLTFADGCGHSEDPAHGVCHIPEPGRPDDIWWFGFDCAHLFDRIPGMAAIERRLSRTWTEQSVYRDFSYVRATCADLAAALAVAG